MINFVSVDKSNITLSSYISTALADNTSKIKNDSIVFFKNQKTIWAKGTFYTCTPAMEQVISDYTTNNVSGTVANTDTILQAIQKLQVQVNGIPQAMVFKGSLGTGGTITTLPTASSSNEGFTYKVIENGTYASIAAKVGDTFISAKTGDNAYSWVLIPSGDEPNGTVTSVGITQGDGISVSGGPITSSGSITVGLANNYGDSKNPYSAKDANKVLAGPTSGTAAAPEFRSLVAADIPDLSSTYEPKFSDGSATIASVSNGEVTLRAGISQSGGAISNSSDSDITLAKVATTGSYSDLSNKPTIGTGAFKIYAGSTEVGGTSANATGDTSVTFVGLGGISVQKASGTGSTTVNISLDWEELN